MNPLLYALIGLLVGAGVATIVFAIIGLAAVAVIIAGAALVIWLIHQR